MTQYNLLIVCSLAIGGIIISMLDAVCTVLSFIFTSRSVFQLLRLLCHGQWYLSDLKSPWRRCSSLLSHGERLYGVAADILCLCPMAILALGLPTL